MFTVYSIYVVHKRGAYVCSCQGQAVNVAGTLCYVLNGVAFV
jgi:hypothetical protein